MNLISYFRIAKSQFSMLAAITLLVVGYVQLTAFMQPIGWLCLIIGAAITLTRNKSERRYYFLILVGAIIMVLTPINTATDLLHLIVMSSGMALALAIPYVISHRIFRDPLIKFGLSFRRWTKLETTTVLFIISTTAICLYLYFMTSSAHESWPLETPNDIAIVFISIMLIGLWEEFFFIASVLAVFKRYLPFVWANLLQAAMFSSFLYQFGFRGWIVPFTFIYALYQGFVYQRFNNLTLNVVIHVVVDLLVFAVLIISAGQALA